MKLIGLMVVKNEEWILGLSLRAALEWCDEVVVVDNGSRDGTSHIISEIGAEHPWRIRRSRYVAIKTVRIPNAHDGELRDVEVEDEDGWWDEMDVRQHSLLLGRKFGGTHFAMVDADEVLMANLMDRVRRDCSALEPGQVLEYPMYAMRTLDEYQDDGSVWCGRNLSLAFRDKPGLAWRPDGSGYHFHHRNPYGTSEDAAAPLKWGKDGGVFHLQFAAERRLVAKHLLYAMTERIRWPDRDTLDKVNWRYSLALDRPGNLCRVPGHWWGTLRRDKVKLDAWPWHEGEIRKLVGKYGHEPFKGINLCGHRVKEDGCLAR